MPSGPAPAPMSASARRTFKPAAGPAVAAVAAVVALAAIVAAAIFLRFYDLASNPGGLYGDEAAEGLDAWRLLHQPGFHADFFVWFTSDGGREALFAYVVAGVFNFAGASVLALRATAAAFGVAGVLAIGHLARRFGTWTGIVAAAWAAGSLWLVCVSRDGMRNMIVPFFGAVALMALLRWAARPGRGTAILAGAVTSLAATVHVPAAQAAAGAGGRVAAVAAARRSPHVRAPARRSGAVRRGVPGRGGADDRRGGHGPDQLLRPGGVDERAEPGRGGGFEPDRPRAPDGGDVRPDGRPQRAPRRGGVAAAAAATRRRGGRRSGAAVADAPRRRATP